MADAEAVHLLTDLGALCGTPEPYRWSLNEARTTCPSCLYMLRAGLLRPCAAGMDAIRKVVTLANRNSR